MFLLRLGSLDELGMTFFWDFHKVPFTCRSRMFQSGIQNYSPPPRYPRIPLHQLYSLRLTRISGQLRNLPMQEITEETAIYYIGETAITNGETLIFTINITPEGEGTQTLRYMQQFFAD